MRITSRQNGYTTTTYRTTNDLGQTAGRYMLLHEKNFLAAIFGALIRRYTFISCKRNYNNPTDQTIRELHEF